MDILFPIAGVHLNVLAVAGLGAVVGLLSGVFGVGGGFLLTPLLMMIGVPSIVAAASDSNQIVAASVSGAMAHSKLGNVDWKLGLTLVAGGWFGGLAGTQLVHRLMATGNAAFVIQIAYVVMLSVVGSYMFYESTRSMFKKNKNKSNTGGAAKLPLLARLPGQMYFRYAGMHASVYALVGLGFLTGVLAALMGVGGGFIMLPVLIYLVGIPTGIAVGTSLVTVLFTAAEVTLTQSMVNHTVDMLLALVLLAGSSVGAQIGVRIGRQLKAEQVRVVFSLIVLITMGTMVYGLLAAPHTLISMVGGGQ
ncbi:MAG TPA: sulfite exporter TauE/SafE family protein [Spirochaetia bacterium]|nr:sulfite exporter TauE/SafE family protein [Spirochaetia bacterium]